MYDAFQPLLALHKSLGLIGAAGFALLGIVFLLPVGDAPWFSFWREWIASAGVLLIALGIFIQLRESQRPVLVELHALPGLGLMLGAIVTLQYLFGKVLYIGDALLMAANLIGFAICVCLSSSLPRDEREVLADNLAYALLFASLGSALLAWAQWLGWLTPEMNGPMHDGRPVAHMQQANLLCTLLILGSLAAWRLHSGGHVATGALLAMELLLMTAMVLTQSRVAWLVMAAVLPVVIYRRRELNLQKPSWALVCVAFLFIAATCALLFFNSQRPEGGLTLANRATGGRRPDAWALFLDATLQKPWAGWGALNNGSAQFEAALRHPSLGYYFSSAHNLVLDLAIWFGWPLALFAGGAVLWAVVRRLFCVQTAPALITALSGFALVLHSLVEFPLHYAYFFLPLGLMLGVTSSPEETLHRRGVSFSTRRTVPLALLGIIPTIFLAFLAREYIAITDVRPFLGIDKRTKHLVLISESAVPQVKLLDELRAFHEFAAIPLRQGGTDAELMTARQVVQRMPYAPSIERYARLLAHSGRQTQAAEALERLCKFLPPVSCAEHEKAWSIWREEGDPLPPWPATGAMRD